MRYLRQSTQQTRVLGPVVSTTDYSRKADLGYNASGMDFNVYKNGTKVDVSPASGAGDECWAASVNGYYDFTFSASDTDTVGSLMVTVDATGYTCPPHTFSVLSGAVYDALFGSTALSTLAGTAQSGDAYAQLGTLIGTPVNTGGTATIAAILGDPANSSLVARTTSSAIADAILGRNIGGGSDGGRTVGSALAPARNKVTITGSGNPYTMTVYATDDSTSLWTAAVTIDPSTGAITVIDPA